MGRGVKQEESIMCACRKKKKILRGTRAEAYCTEDPITPLAWARPQESQGPECTEMCVRAETCHEIKVYLDTVWPGWPTVPFQSRFSLQDRSKHHKAVPKCAFFPCFLQLTHGSESGCSDRSPALHFDTCPNSYPNAEQAVPGARAGIQPLALF